MLQITAFPNQTSAPINLGQAVSAGAGIGTYFLYVLIFVALILILLFIMRYFLRRQYGVSEAFRNIVLFVLVPRESAKSGKGEEETLSARQEDIAVAEIFLSAIGGLGAEKGFFTWLTGKKQKFSFEIVSQDGLISFYLSVPSHRKDFIEEQIHAQYPSAQIEEIKDYNIFSPQGSAVGAYMILKRPGVFPIKTYRKTESDPLSSLINALGKVERQDGAAIQILVRPAVSGWRAQGHHIVSEMQKGKKLKDVLSENLLKEIFKALKGILKASGKSDSTNEIEKPYQPSQMEVEMMKGIEEKISKAGFEVNVRIVSSAPTYERASIYIDNIVDAFGQYSIYEYGNSFRKMSGGQENLMKAFIYRDFNERRKILLNTEELASIYHFPLPGTEAPNIKWLVARSAEPPSNMPKEGIILGRNMYRGKETLVRMDDEARRRHLYSIGQTGTGKSVFLQELIKQDIRNGKGVCVLEPHEDLIKDVIGCIPKERMDDVVYFNPSDSDRPLGLNLLEFDPRYPEQKTFVINELLSIFDKLFDLKATGGPMFEQYARNAMLLIMEHPESGSTLMEIPKVFADEDFRKFKLKHCKNQVVYDFWVKEAEKAGGEASLANLTTYVTSKLTPFISNDIMRPIISQQKSTINIRDIMDNKKILFLNLSKGMIGDINAYLLGMVLVGKLWAAALSRADLPAEKRHDFFLYIDEFHNFTTATIASILSEARKYRLNLIITHQYISQLVKDNDTRIRDAVFGNVGNTVCFRVGPEDGEFMEQQLAPVFTKHDLINISNFNAYVKIVAEQQVTRPFNMEIYRHFDPWHKEAEQLFGMKEDEKVASAIKEISRLKYGRDRGTVEAEIKRRHKLALL